MSAVRYTKAHREQLHAERRNAELARRAALTEAEAIAEIANAVHLEADGTVAVWAESTQTDIVYRTPAEYVDQYRVSVGCCHRCPK